MFKEKINLLKKECFLKKNNGDENVVDYFIKGILTEKNNIISKEEDKELTSLKLELSLLAEDLLFKRIEECNDLISYIDNPSKTLQLWVISKDSNKLISKLQKLDKELKDKLKTTNINLYMNLNKNIVTNQEKIDLIQETGIYVSTLEMFSDKELKEEVINQIPCFLYKIINRNYFITEKYFTQEDYIKAFKKGIFEFILLINDKESILTEEEKIKMSLKKEFIDCFKEMKNLSKEVIKNLLNLNPNNLSFLSEQVSEKEILKIIKKNNHFIKYLKNPSLKTISELLKFNYKNIKYFTNVELSFDIWKSILDIDKKMIRYFEKGDKKVISYVLEKDLNSIYNIKLSVLEKLFYK